VNTREELENSVTVLKEAPKNYDYLHEFEHRRIENRAIGRKHRCPRCRSVTVLQTEAPYCSYCNWDSLEDQTNFQFD
jgi:hypothetical protein